MKEKIFVLIVTVLFTQNLFAQNQLPVIKANSTHVDILENNKLLRNQSWNIDPKIALDVYATCAEKVTFRTDLEDITFEITPEVGEYNFIILLNGTDSARTQIKYYPSYLFKKTRFEILKGARKYNYSDSRFIPEFTYQPATNPDLQRIRQELKLDSIAGTGDELSQIFNLLHWVHNLIRHDGSSDNPVSKNAIDLIEICNRENRGVNCRMMAMILNECYLSMGIKSRYVTCMPKEAAFEDCHVINMVFSKDLDKWIWADPTFAAYLMNENGDLLGIQEVRERLIKGQTLIINADANWNGESLQTKKLDYLDYMAKNLYRMECSLSSEYNLETWKTGNEVTYVELLPLDGEKQTPQKAELIKEKTGVKIINYKTNNPDLFWTRPK